MTCRCQGQQCISTIRSISPILMQFSSVLRKLLSVNLITRSPLRLSKFLTQELA
jgi:hypothetical protein